MFRLACIDGLRLPLIGAPLFIISHPPLVIAQCRSGIVGSLPSLNARTTTELDEWLAEIGEALAAPNPIRPGREPAPFAVNLIPHKSNDRWERDLEICVGRRVPLVITSLGARADVHAAVRSYGGVTLHDVTRIDHAEKALDRGAQGLIAIAAGAGGHCGALSPFALVQEIRARFNGPLFLGGCLATGDAILAAQAMGADGGYMGSAFIACDEARAVGAYKDAIVAFGAEDIVGTDYFTGVYGNYLAPSIAAIGLDPRNLPPRGTAAEVRFDSKGENVRAWRDIWGAGQGIGAVTRRVPVAELVDQLENQYGAARTRLFAAAGGASEGRRAMSGVTGPSVGRLRAEEERIIGLEQCSEKA
jgi:nitronate monooxygenase